MISVIPEELICMTHQESHLLSGIMPVYRLIDDSELMLTIYAAQKREDETAGEEYD
jgi:hypothetical protein